MSPDLASLQHEMTRAILAASFAAPSSIGDDMRHRFAVYRNTALSGLADALRIGYPMTEKVVGSAFFDQTALAFVRAKPPSDPVLSRYGAGFGDFLATVPAVASLAYLPDLARLEWAVDQAAGEPTQHSGGRAFVLSTGDGVITVTLAPSLQLVATRTSVKALWECLRAGDDAALASIRWDAGPENLAVHHTPDGVAVASLSPAAWSAFAALLDGEDIETALADKEGADPISLATEMLNAPFIHISRSESTR